MRLAHAAAWMSVALLTSVGAVADKEIRHLVCTSRAQPNSIAGQHPDLPTGVLNGTVVLLPVNFDIVRRFVPSQYPILTAAYKELLPWWPENQHPVSSDKNYGRAGLMIHEVILQSNIDHDVRVGPSGTSFDFSRSALYFPFVDRLNDGYTSMTYSDNIFLSDSAPAIAGTLAYGYTIVVGDFDPACDGYRSFASGQTGFDVVPAIIGNDTEYISGRFVHDGASPIPIEFWKNVTNQPQASRSDTCDNYIRLFNTSLSDENVAVRGIVKEEGQLQPGEQSVFNDVWGIQGAWAFVERNYLPCQSLQGYSG